MTRRRFRTTATVLAAARAMFAALRAVQERLDADNKRMRVVDDAIAQAEAAGIKAEG